MPLRTSNPATPARSTTGKTPGSKSIRVWGEVGITVNLGDFNNIKIVFGHERVCQDNDEAIARCERQIYKRNSEVVSRRAEEAARLVQSMLSES
jgi:hypothetical protein